MSLWDLIQQYQLFDQQKTAETLEEKVAYLEKDLNQTRQTLSSLLKLLEEKFGEDLNGDGRVE